MPDEPPPIVHIYAAHSVDHGPLSHWDDASFRAPNGTCGTPTFAMLGSEERRGNIHSVNIVTTFGEGHYSA